MASSPSRLGTATGKESRVPWREKRRRRAESPREERGRERERRREKPPSSGRGRAASPSRLALPHSLTRTPRWRRPPPPPRSLPQPPRLPAAPGRGRGRAETPEGHIILTIGERNYRAYGNHGLGLLQLNSELSPAASLLSPAPPQRRTDRRLPLHCAGARGTLGVVVPPPSRLGRARAGPQPRRARGVLRGRRVWLPPRW